MDLYQAHRFDYETPIEETMRAFDDLVRAGKVRYIGSSTFPASLIVEAQWVAKERGRERFVCEQPPYSILVRGIEQDVLPTTLRHGMGVIPWSPLARGFLAGNRAKAGGGETTRAKTDDFAGKLYYDESDFAVADRNFEIAKKLGVKPMQTALAWVLANPAVTAPIIGASKLSHLDDALGALEIQLTPADKSALEEPYKPHRTLGFD